jgi:hypothetical protein
MSAPCECATRRLYDSMVDMGVSKETVDKIVRGESNGPWEASGITVKELYQNQTRFRSEYGVYQLLRRNKVPVLAKGGQRTTALVYDSREAFACVMRLGKYAKE